MQHNAAVDTYRSPVDLVGLGYAYWRIVYSLHKAVWAKLEQLLYVCSAAAAAVKHIGIVIQFQVFKPPVRQRAVANVHHGDHYSSTKPGGLARIIKECHSFTSSQPF